MESKNIERRLVYLMQRHNITREDALEHVLGRLLAHAANCEKAGYDVKVSTIKEIVSK